MSYYKSAGDGPIVVQGQEVPPSQQGGFSQALNDPAQRPAYVSSSTTSAAQYQTPAAPPRGCRDALFAVLFYVHLGLIAYAAAVNTPIMAQEVGEGYINHADGWGRRRLNDGEGDGEDSNFDPVHLFITIVIATILAFVVSTLALGFMMTCAQPLIKMSLYFNILLFGVLMIVSFATGATPMGVVFLLLMGISAWYAYRVWNRIPFAASNLVTAVTAVKANIGLAVYAYWSVLVLFFWSVVWALSTSSTIFVEAECNADGECEGSVSGILLFCFFLSFYWTSQIITNVVHVTTAGTVGTWWFHPEEASGCCSRAVRESYGRSLTSSFGSICFGSLLVAIVQTLKEMAHHAQSGDDSILRCVAICILGCIESLIEYFNKWAFVFVGIHGFSFMEAGKNAMTLFRTRGWTAIITDTMIDTVLFMVSLGVALLIGTLSVVIGATMVNVEDSNTMAASFILGFLLGYGICATLFSIVSSAVNTVIVCFGEAPNEFQMNHPELSENMLATWREAWPNDFSY
mmetsp:Transcript_15057/g.31044  ORF Transcript_15057/g.31044 Transcript_15057/m.31044 type:complete len:516 (-) Transcript_15057:127-1674(-)